MTKIEFNVQEFEQFKIFAEEYCKDAEHTAGMSGACDDGGAGGIRRELRIFEAGMNYEIPEEFKKLYKNFLREYNKKKNPDEYKEFKRLREIFEE